MEKRIMIPTTLIEPVGSSNDLPDTTLKTHSRKSKKVNPVQSLPRQIDQPEIEEVTTEQIPPQQEQDQDLHHEELKQIQIQFCQTVPEVKQVGELNQFLEETLQSNTDEEIRDWNPANGREYNSELIQYINKLLEVMKWSFGTPVGQNIKSADDFIIIEGERQKQVKILELRTRDSPLDIEINESVPESFDLQKGKDPSAWIQETGNRKEVQSPEHLVLESKEANEWTELEGEKKINEADLQKVANFIKTVCKSNRTSKIQEEIFKYKDEMIKEIKRIISEVLYPSSINSSLVREPKLMKDIAKLVKVAKWTFEKEPLKRKGKKNLKKQDDTSERKSQEETDDIPTFEFSADNLITPNLNQIQVNNGEQEKEEMEVVNHQIAKRKNEMEGKDQSTMNSNEFKKRKSGEIIIREERGDKKERFCIEVARYSRRNDGIVSSHIKSWNYESPKGFGIFIKGRGYQKGCVEKILDETEEEFGAIKNIFSDRAYTLVVMKNEQDREKMIDILKEHKDLEVESAKYRFPQIKFSVHESMLTEGTEKLVEEIKKWNGLKKFKKEKMVLSSIHPINNTRFVILVLEVHPHIRNHIIETLDGEIRIRNKSFTLSDHFEIRKCRKCGSIKHGWCGSEKHCMNCSRVHNKDMNCTYPKKCLTCKGGHTTFTLDCPPFKREIENKMDFSTTPFDLITSVFPRLCKPLVKEDLANDSFIDLVKNDKKSTMELFNKIDKCENPGMMVTIRGVTSNNLKGMLLIYALMGQKKEINLHKMDLITKALNILETNVRTALTVKNERLMVQGIISESVIIGIIIYENSWTIPEVIQRNIQAKWINISTKWKTLLRLKPLDSQSEIREILSKRSWKTLMVIMDYHLAQQANHNNLEIQQQLEKYLGGFGENNYWLYTKINQNNECKNYVFLKKEIYLNPFKEGIKIEGQTLHFDIVAKYTICKKCGKPKTCNHPPKQCDVPSMDN
uniref:Uncharacterized protein n=1 Tax=Tetranychus urticae TaxID=32264 RepID=T1L6G1_TETUR